MMKTVVMMVVTCSIAQYTLGQACGIYRLKYVGNVKSESLKIESIKLPDTRMLHGFEVEPPQNLWVVVESTNHNFDALICSHLSSSLYGSAEDLLKFYKANRDSVPLVVIATQNNITSEIQITVPWHDIQITKIEDGKFGNLFEFNLNTIIID